MPWIKITNRRYERCELCTKRIAAWRQVEDSEERYAICSACYSLENPTPKKYTDEQLSRILSQAAIGRLQNAVFSDTPERRRGRHAYQACIEQAAHAWSDWPCVDDVVPDYDECEDRSNDYDWARHVGDLSNRPSPTEILAWCEEKGLA